MADVRVVLASGSPRRRELLGRIAVGIEVRAPDVDETPRSSETARELVGRLARTKVGAVRGADDALVVGGDTVVVVDGRILGKPADAEEAEQMLRSLSGRTHEVLTGFALAYGGRTVDGVVEVRVAMGALTDERLAWYLGTGEWQGKAGAYAIQGRGAVLVESITGDPTAVIGLPLAAVAAGAAGLGAILVGW